MKILILILSILLIQTYCSRKHHLQDKQKKPDQMMEKQNVTLTQNNSLRQNQTIENSSIKQQKIKQRLDRAKKIKCQKEFLKNKKKTILRHNKNKDELKEITISFSYNTNQDPMKSIVCNLDKIFKNLQQDKDLIKINSTESFKNQTPKIEQNNYVQQ